jgi:hypothetical protein
LFIDACFVQGSSLARLPLTLAHQILVITNTHFFKEEPLLFAPPQYLPIKHRSTIPQELLPLRAKGLIFSSIIAFKIIFFYPQPNSPPSRVKVFQNHKLNQSKKMSLGKPCHLRKIANLATS